MKKATCCARGYICLLDLQKFETVHEIEDHLALNYNYTRPNKIELLEKKIKGEFLEEALEIGKSGRRRKKVDYNKDIDISGGKDEEGDDEEMNRKMKKIKLHEDSILSDDSDGSFDKKMRKELASQSAEDDDDEDSDEDSENSIASDIPTPEESEILDHNDINDIMADITSSTPKKNTRIKTEFNSSSNLSQKNNKRKTPKKEFAYTPQPSATGPNQKATDFKNLHRETILDHKNLAAHINQTCTIPTNLWKMPENKKFLNSSFPDKEFKLQKKLSEDEKNISSWPFVFNQENEQIYEINGVIEQTSNRFSFFAGHEAIQTLFIEEFLLVVSVTYIDFFEPKKAKKENQSQGNLTYNFIGRLHFDLSRINQLITEENGPSKEATVCKVPQFCHPEYSTTKNLIFVGYINSEVDVFQIDLINRKFSLLHTIRNDMVEISCFNHNLGQVDAMDISSSNEYLAVSYSISSSIFIYRILDFEVMAIIEEHEKNIKCLSFCPWNDHLIVSGSYDRKLYYHNWMDSPDFPIEFLNQNYQSAVFTSSVWPLMCPGLIVTTENAFAGDKMYGTHLYWIDNGNFEPPSGRPSIIFGPRQTMWKCDYSGFLNCLVVVDEAGCCYLSALPNFRRRWSVLKAIGFRIR